MAINNPITDANVISLNWAEQPERKLAGLLTLFLERYFSGSPFQTRDAGGGLRTVTWPQCKVDMQETQLSNNPNRPVIDVTFDTIHAEREDRSAGKHGHREEWLLTILTKVPASMPGIPGVGTNAEYAVRKIASHVQWLFRSAELDALGAHGVHHVSVARPPTVFSAGAWLGRLMTVTLVTHGEQVR
jgi:hypothetical protein